MRWLFARYFPRPSPITFQKFSYEMVFLSGPHLANDLDEEDFVVLEGNRASKAPMGQSLLEKLRLSEISNKSLEAALNEKHKSLIVAEAEHARELRDKEIKNRRIIGNLQVQLDEARGQLYGGQPQSFSGILASHSLDESEYRQLANYITETAWLRGYYPKVLVKAAGMVHNKNHQDALVHLDTNISATDSTTLHANATLLKSSILRIADDPQRGLELAEHVVYIANLNDLPTLLGKAQLYRGLCLFDLGLYADAIRCYVRAASIRWFAREVTRMTMIAEERRNALPSGSRGKQLSPDFHEIPLSTSDKGFGSYSVRL
jgi:tetratricopeptide (TPR) repeat protein